MWSVASEGLISDLASLQKRLLANRGLRGETSNWFEPKYESSLHDPDQFENMSQAIDRIKSAADKQESVVVYGDYDADGVTSSAIMLSLLKQAGISAVPYLPHRETDGYGLNAKALARLISQGVDLVITVDCGIKDLDEIKWLKDQGVDVIVVDHHTVADKLPDAIVVHPGLGDYPWRDLCGAAVAWKLAYAYAKKFKWDEDWAKWLLDLVAIGTIGDVMPLVDENRALVIFGLEILKRTRRPGLQALMERLKISDQISAESVAYRIVPCLNAAGRMDHAQPALDLLLEEDSVIAAELADGLNKLNNRRQTVTRKIVKEAEEVVEVEQVVFAYSDQWPAGLVGIVAGRLAEKYQKPAVVVGSNGREAVGSARSKNGNILDILKASEEKLLRLGGHAQAAGFSLEHEVVSAWRIELQKAAINTSPPAPLLGKERGDREVEAELCVDPSVLSWDLLNWMDKLEPFGEGNAKPVFLVQNMSLLEARVIGSDKTHLKCSLKLGDSFIDAIGFGLAPEFEALTGQETVDVIASLEVNEWQSRRNLQLSLKDIAPVGVRQVVYRDEQVSEVTH